MARSRHKKSSPWVTLMIWGTTLCLMGWGLKQAVEFRRSILAEVSEAETPASNPEDAPLATQAAIAIEAAHLDGNASTHLSPTVDLDLPEMAHARGDAPLLPTFDAALTAEALAAEGERLMDDGKLVEGRSALNAALLRGPSAVLAEQLRTSLNHLNAGVFLGPDLLPGDPVARYVEIEPGDSFLKLGREFGLPAAFVGRINPGLNANNLRPMAGVKIIEGPFDIRISKRSLRLDLFAGEMYVASCPVELPEGNLLPLGAYRVSAGSKIQTGPGYDLHTWIGFEGIEPATAEVTNGWIYSMAAGSNPRGGTTKDLETGFRLADSDLRQLYNVLVETRSHVIVDP